MGNPHFVMLVDEFAPGWQREAAEVGVLKQFEHGTNVELVKVVGPHEIEIRIFERRSRRNRVFGHGIVRVGSCVDLRQTGWFSGEGGESWWPADSRVGKRGSADRTGADSLPRRILLLGSLLLCGKNLHLRPVVRQIFAALETYNVGSRFGRNSLAVPNRFGCYGEAVVAVQAAKQSVNNLGEHGRLPFTNNLDSGTLLVVF